ncbi:hypothetical protein CK203_044600 [Vitis vinifera]|uniref:Reverse transcriptase/retrotransposon-derived protein RNase H-like domain-containing protein n=1 Tax=Vitis vinifera TaxID=29760 RepID=A0A438HJJ7_VITVI|nr:hypothetical protein CK203_044600 [Vitis vinifera]
MIGICCILEAAPHEPHSAFDMFEVSMLELDGDDSITDVATPDLTSVKEALDPMDPPLSFDSMFGFVISYDIHDIDDVGDPDGPLSGQSDCDSDSEERKVTPISSSTESVKEEIQKPPSVSFLSMVEYPEWLANVVTVPKNDDKVRVRVDFRDLNKANPKDDFLLPHIDMLVDSTVGHSMLSFVDRFSRIGSSRWGCNYGDVCFPNRVMPFGLKNAGATYHRVATTLFHDMMHKDVEIYMDDMIVKSQDRAVWNDDCQHTFEKIKECLISPPVLMPPTPGSLLLLYLSVLDIVLECMLAQLDDLGKERAIYYLSKRMLEYQRRYIMIERLCLALVWATRRLRHYVIEYSIRLVS